MAKDILGNTLKPGDSVIFNNMQCTIKEINENRLLGGTQMTAKGIHGMKIPDSMTLEIDIMYDADKPINCFAVRVPVNNEKEAT